MYCYGNFKDEFTLQLGKTEQDEKYTKIIRKRAPDGSVFKHHYKTDHCFCWFSCALQQRTELAHIAVE